MGRDPVAPRPQARAERRRRTPADRGCLGCHPTAVSVPLSRTAPILRAANATDRGPSPRRSLSVPRPSESLLPNRAVTPQDAAGRPTYLPTVHWRPWRCQPRVQGRDGVLRAWRSFNLVNASWDGPSVMAYVEAASRGAWESALRINSTTTASGSAILEHVEPSRTVAVTPCKGIHGRSLRGSRQTSPYFSPHRQSWEEGESGLLSWSPLTESNRRPSPYHGDALPTELRGPAAPLGSPGCPGMQQHRARRAYTNEGKQVPLSQAAARRSAGRLTAMPPRSALTSSNYLRSRNNSRSTWRSGTTAVLSSSGFDAQHTCWPTALSAGWRRSSAVLC